MLQALQTSRAGGTRHLPWPWHLRAQAPSPAPPSLPAHCSPAAQAQPASYVCTAVLQAEQHLSPANSRVPPQPLLAPLYSTVLTCLPLCPVPTFPTEHDPRGQLVRGEGAEAVNTQGLALQEIYRHSED